MSDTSSIDRAELQRQADWVAQNIYRGGLPFVAGAENWRTYKVSSRKVKALASGQLQPDGD